MTPPLAPFPKCCPPSAMDQRPLSRFRALAIWLLGLGLGLMGATTAQAWQADPDNPAAPRQSIAQPSQPQYRQTSQVALAAATQPLPGQPWVGLAVGPYGGQVIVDSPSGSAMLPPSFVAPQFSQPSMLGPEPPPAMPGYPAPVPRVFGQIPLCPSPDDLFMNYYDPFSTQFTYGLDGVQPYQYGWLSYNDVVYIPESPAQGVPGQMQIIEWNSWLRYSRRIGNHLLFSWTPEFNGEFWQPPAGLGLPTFVNELKSDFKLASVNPGPWNWQVGFTPQLNADLKRSLDANAYLFDGRAVALFRASPKLTLAVGVEYWNRVHNYVIPYGGIIWTPDNRWEFRLLFPNARVSYYLGNFHSLDVWAYASAEFLIEAYQIDTTAGVKERGQWQDYEVLFGFDVGKGKFSAFLQAGAIFDRKVQFNGPTPDFNLGNSVIVRTGLIF